MITIDPILCLCSTVIIVTLIIVIYNYLVNNSITWRDQKIEKQQELIEQIKLKNNITSSVKILLEQIEANTRRVKK